MVSKPSLVTITQAEIEQLCERLGHDPRRVARITIEPHVVVVEYEHPVTATGPADVVQHITVKPPPPPPGPASASRPSSP